MGLRMKLYGKCILVRIGHSFAGPVVGVHEADLPFSFQAFRANRIAMVLGGDKSMTAILAEGDRSRLISAPVAVLQLKGLAALGQR